MKTHPNRNGLWMSFFVVYPVEICYDEEDKRNGERRSDGGDRG